MAESQGQRARLPRPSGRRLLVGAAITLVAVGVLAELLSGATNPDAGEPRRSTSSSFGTGDAGTRGFADLLDRYGFDVRRQVGALRRAQLPANATIFLLDAPQLSRAEADELLAAVADGATLVVGGPDPPFLSLLRDDPPTWAPAIRSGWNVDDAVRFPGVRTVVTGGEGRFAAPGGTTVVVGDRRDSLVTDVRVLRGRIVFLADTTLLDNQLIGARDNAAFAVDLAGGRPGPVVFAEGIHGFAGPKGWRAIPARWKVALLVLIGAALLLAWSRAVRLGPPEAGERELAPSRAQYVDAVAATLHHIDDRVHARRRLASDARTALARRGNPLGDAPTTAQLEIVAALTGATVSDLRALLSDDAPIDDAQLLAATRAFNAIERRGPLMAGATTGER